MAARALTTGPAEHVYERLETLAPSAYWRNTCLLAYGRLYTSREFERDALLERIRRLDSGTTVGAFVGYGSRLAIDLLDDDFGISVPAHRRSLLVLAMSQVGRWPGPELKKLSAIARVAINGTDKRSAGIVSETLKDASQSIGKSRLGAKALVHDWERETKNSGRAARAVLDQFQNADAAAQRGSGASRTISASRALLSAERNAELSSEESLQWSALQETLLDHITMFATTTDAEAVQLSRRDLDWTIPEDARDLLESPEIREVIIRVCDSARVTEGAAVILLRRALIATDESTPRGLNRSLADLGADIPTSWKDRFATGLE